jgi:hypothetical protein
MVKPACIEQSTANVRNRNEEDFWPYRFVFPRSIRWRIFLLNIHQKNDIAGMKNLFISVRQGSKTTME